jgi:hypothetical protein
VCANCLQSKKAVTIFVPAHYLFFGEAPTRLSSRARLVLTRPASLSNISARTTARVCLNVAATVSASASCGALTRKYAVQSGSIFSCPWLLPVHQWGFSFSRPSYIAASNTSRSRVSFLTAQHGLVQHEHDLRWQNPQLWQSPTTVFMHVMQHNTRQHTPVPVSGVAVTYSIHFGSSLLSC